MAIFGYDGALKSSILVWQTPPAQGPMIAHAAFPMAWDY